jgi:NTP pyrophosphatase (non-canonical NTP hydrolase)
LLGEVGELAELVQWKGDDEDPSFDTKELDKLSQELADVSIYLLRLATVRDVVTPLCEQAWQEDEYSSNRPELL